MSDITVVTIDKDYLGNTVYETVTEAEVTSINRYRRVIGTVRTFYVKPAINLYDLFVSKIGRNPGANEKVDFIINGDVAIVGYKTVSMSGGKVTVGARTTYGSAINVDVGRWPSTCSIRVQAIGLVLGAGSNSRGINDDPTGTGIHVDQQRLGFAGGDPIVLTESTSTISGRFDIRLYLGTNTGCFYGGGGAGGIGFFETSWRRYSYGIAGGGGAPYGKAATSVIPSGVSHTITAEATNGRLLSGGVGGKCSNANIYGGDGRFIENAFGDPGGPLLNNINGSDWNSGGTNYGANLVEVPAGLPEPTVEPKNEYLTFKVNHNGVQKSSATILIVDKSFNTSSTVYWSANAWGNGTITQTKEGVYAYLVVNTKNIMDRTKLTCTLTGISAGDVAYNGLLVQEMEVFNNQVIFPWFITDDLITEGSETITATIRRGSTVLATSILPIIDTSLAPKPVYEAFWSSTSNGNNPISEVGEGSKIYFIVKTTNVPNGTVLNVLMPGNDHLVHSVDAADIVNYQHTTNVTINNNFGYIEVELKADLITEGKEWLQGILRNSSGTILANNQIYINDTSLTPVPTYTLDWRATATGTSIISSINEGSTAWLIIGGANIPNGTVVTVKLSGTGINAADFTDNLIQKDIVIQNNVGRTSFSLANDLVKEGTETIIANLIVAGENKASAQLVVNDTSYTEDIIITGTFYKSEVYNNKTYNVYDALNLYDYFVSKTGRAPLVGENIRFIVESNTAIAGRGYTQTGMTLDNRFDKVSSLTLVNHGIILGHGAKAVTSSSNGATGHNAIVNTGAVNLRVQNYGIVAGGGGGGGGRGLGREGCPASPYGGKSAHYWVDVADFATNDQSGTYGDWGNWGKTIRSLQGGAPGYVAIGAVTITNYGSGWWKGREGSAGI